MDLTPEEIRVLGCLIEKRKTTPDTYPLTLNALRLACNQSTSREPVVDYDDATIRDALERLGRRGWTRFAGGHASRAAKYRHLFDEVMSLTDGEMAILGVLMLTGPQTFGEIRRRSDRLHTFANRGRVESTLTDLMTRGLVVAMDRRPGQKEGRYGQTLGADRSVSASETILASAPGHASDSTADLVHSGRFAALEKRVAALEEALAGVHSRLHN